MKAESGRWLSDAPPPDFWAEGDLTYRMNNEHEACQTAALIHPRQAAEEAAKKWYINKINDLERTDQEEKGTNERIVPKFLDDLEGV